MIIKCNTTHLTAQWKLCPGESIWCSPSRLWIDNAFRFLTALICKNSMSNSLSTIHPIFGKSPIHKNIWRLTHLRAHSHPLTLCSPSRLWIDFGFSQICKITWATLYRRRIQYLADRTRSTRIPTLPQLNKWCETFPLYYYLPALGMVWNTNWCKIQHCWCLCQRLIMYLVQWSSIFAKKKTWQQILFRFQTKFWSVIHKPYLAGVPAPVWGEARCFSFFSRRFMMLAHVVPQRSSRCFHTSGTLEGRVLLIDGPLWSSQQMNRVIRREVIRLTGAILDSPICPTVQLLWGALLLRSPSLWAAPFFLVSV